MPPPLAAPPAPTVVIGVGDSAVSRDPRAILSTFALGSCIGLVAYDSIMKSGGMIHLMLPESRISPGKAAAQPAMFADTGLPFFIQQLASVLVDRGRLKLLIAGGANVLKGTDPFRIGEMNAKATFGFLQKNGYPVKYQSVGGNFNRTLHLEIGTGTVTLKTPQGTEQVSLA